MEHSPEQLEIMHKAGVGHMADAPIVPAATEEDFLAGVVPSCNLGEACESCT